MSGLQLSLPAARRGLNYATDCMLLVVFLAVWPYRCRTGYSEAQKQARDWGLVGIGFQFAFLAAAFNGLLPWEEWINPTLLTVRLWVSVILCIVIFVVYLIQSIISGIWATVTDDGKEEDDDLIWDDGGLLFRWQKKRKKENREGRGGGKPHITSLCVAGSLPQLTGARVIVFYLPPLFISFPPPLHLPTVFAI